MKAFVWNFPEKISEAKPFISFSQWLCDLLTGHVQNPSEHGYGGGDFCDHWCRYCDKMFQIPLIECVECVDGKAVESRAD